MLKDSPEELIWKLQFLICGWRKDMVLLVCEWTLVVYVWNQKFFIKTMQCVEREVRRSQNEILLWMLPTLHGKNPKKQFSLPYPFSSILIEKKRNCGFFPRCSAKSIRRNTLQSIHQSWKIQQYNTEQQKKDSTLTNNSEKSSNTFSVI